MFRTSIGRAEALQACRLVLKSVKCQVHCSLFLDKEEDNVIRLSSLEDDAAAAETAEQVHAVYKRFVNFHGELLLMVHWSILAYTGLVKILKKHHKRTGLLVRAPHLDNLLSQPFCSVEVSAVSRVVCGAMLKAISVRAVRASPETAEKHHMDAASVMILAYNGQVNAHQVTRCLSVLLLLIAL